MERRPSPAASSSPLPSLEEVRAEASAAPEPGAPGAASTPRRALALTMAAGVAAVAVGSVAAAHEPVCGTTRAEELEAHGTSAGLSLRRGDVSQTVREIGLALGWVRHAGTTSVGGPPDMTPPGLPEMVTAGAPMPVDPTPPQPQVEGGVRPVQATPHTQPVPNRRPPTAGAPRRVHPVSAPETPRPGVRGGRARTNPTPRERTLGDIVSVSLHPPDGTRRS